jgi:peptide chain release factor 1
MDLLSKLAEIEKRYDQLSETMSQPEVATSRELMTRYGREQAELTDIVASYRSLLETNASIASTQSLLQDADEEMRQMAVDEMATMGARREELLARINQLLLPKDPHDEGDVIMEIRSAEGGEEAALFASDLYRMYAHYAETRRWRTEVIDVTETGIGGLKEIVFEIKGRGAYSRLKYESGGHRVQRIPVTESSGRIHTSLATIAVLPEVEEVEVAINPDDLKVDVFRAGGHGGQNVQKTSTAIRITHLPTGIVVACQDERSQIQNKLKAMNVLRARLYVMEQERIHSQVTESRRIQVGSGERGSKIRTYNFPQDRVTDHRIGLTMHNLPAILAGDLDELINAVARADEAERLQSAGLAA